MDAETAHLMRAAVRQADDAAAQLLLAFHQIARLHADEVVVFERPLTQKAWEAWKAPAPEVPL